MDWVQSLIGELRFHKPCRKSGEKRKSLKKKKRERENEAFFAFTQSWNSTHIEIKVKLLSHVWLFGTPWTVAYQAPTSMGFSRVLELVAISFSWDLLDPGIEPGSPEFQADALTSEPPGKKQQPCGYHIPPICFFSLFILLGLGQKSQKWWLLVYIHPPPFNPLWTDSSLPQTQAEMSNSTLRF